MGNFFNMITFAGARIAGPPTYTPAHMKQGSQKPTSAMIEFNVYGNDGDRKNTFKITAWGKMADILARSGATGKELQMICKAGSYDGKVAIRQPDGSVQWATNPDGTLLTVKKIGFTIQSLVFGADSAKSIAEEIAAGIRPPGWNIAGSPDNINWKNICAQKNAEQYMQGSQKFGYAIVRPLATGAQYIAANVANNAGTAQYAGNPGAVGQTFQTTPGAVHPAPNQPIIVNGQNMGYAPPNNYVQPNQPVYNQPPAPVAPPSNSYIQPAAVVNQPGVVM